MRFKLFLLIPALLAICSFTHAQPLLKWAAAMGSATGIKPTAIAVGNNGRVVTAGSFYGINDFNPGSGVSTLDVTQGNAFITALDSNRNFLWARQMGNLAFDSVFITDICIDSPGNIYLTGSYSGMVDLNPSPSDISIFNIQNGTSREVFICKLNPSGLLIWAQNFSGGTVSSGTSIKTDNKGNLFVAGYFGGNVMVNSGSIPISSLARDMFVVKLDTAGTLDWVRTSAGTAKAYALAVDDSSHVYASGSFSGTTDFAPNVAGGSLTSTAGTDAFIARFDYTGTLAWAKQLAGTGTEEAHSLATDKNGNIVIGGAYTTSIDCDPGTGTYTLGSSQPPQGCYGYFITKLASNGTFTWAVSPAASGICDARLPMSLDAFGNIYVTGDFGDTIDFDPGNGTYNRAPKGPLVVSGVPILHPDIFVSRINADGSLGWARSFGSAYGNERGEDIAVDMKGNVHITGTYTDTVDFDPAAGILNLFTTRIGTIPEKGMYIQKLMQCPGMRDTLNITACKSYLLADSTYKNTGSYTRTFVTAGGCDSIVRLNLTVNTVNTAVTQTATTLTAQATGATYQWINCYNHLNPIVAGANAASFSTAITGSFAVIVTQNNCTDTSDCRILAGTGVPAYDFEHSISLYPNPATDRFTINLGTIQQEVLVEVRNVTGQVVDAKTFTNTSGADMSIDGPKGIYIIKVVNNENRAAFIKLVKE